MTAYWAVYINQELIDQISKIDLYHYLVPSARLIDGNSQINEHFYSDFIPGEIRMAISDENQKLANEIQDWQLTQKVKAI